MADESIRGYRIIGDRPKDRSLSYDYLKQSHPAATALTELKQGINKNGANCVGKWEQWDGDEMPSDREAQIMCASCPVFDLCEKYAELAHPAWTILAGKVYGRNLKAAMGDDE